MTTVDYYPKKSRLDFIGADGMAEGGIIGDRAHIKAAALIQSGSAIVRICDINSKMNKRLKAEYKIREVSKKNLKSLKS